MHLAKGEVASRYRTFTPVGSLHCWGGVQAELAETMQSTTTQDLYAYWNAVRGGRDAPRRFDIEPGQIADLLPDTFILEFAEPSGFRYRLAGTRVCELLGRELRGESFFECFRETDQFALKRVLSTVRKVSAVTHVLAATDGGLSSPRYEIIVLPLRHNGPEIVRFLGAFVALDAHRDGETLCSADRLHLLETEVTYPSEAPAMDDEAVEPTSLGQEPFVFDNVRSARIVRQDRRQFRVYNGGRAETNDQS